MKFMREERGGGRKVVTAAASNCEGKTFADTKKENQKGPKASPEPIAWIKEVEKRQAAIAAPTGEDDNDDDMEWGSGLPQILLTLSLTGFTLLWVQSKPETRQ